VYIFHQGNDKLICIKPVLSHDVSNQLWLLLVYLFTRVSHRTTRNATNLENMFFGSVLCTWRGGGGLCF